ncbi:hypothetical protein VLG1_10070 [Lactobacillus paragasseri]|nr:hypothetical protein PGA11657_14570 [Lactobacillus paragasseri]
MVTFKPRFLSKRPKLEAEIPLPNDETTPPVTKIYFVMPCFLSFLLLFVKIKKKLPSSWELKCTQSAHTKY